LLRLIVIIFIIDNDQLVDTFKHLEQVLFKLADVLKHANNLDDLLVTEKVKAGEIFSLGLQVLDEAFHEIFECLHHGWHIVSETFSLAELFVGLALTFRILHLFTI